MEAMRSKLMLLWCLLLASCSTCGIASQPLSADEIKNLKPHYASIQEGQIEYYRFGHGKPIVLIPGYATDLSSWNRTFLMTLAQHNQVIIFNNRRVGASFVKSKSYESKDLASDTYQLIKKLGLKRPAVLGVSMGGMIAQQYAVLYPQEVGQLILINTAIAGHQAVYPAKKVQEDLFNIPDNKLSRYALALKLFFPEQWKLRMAYSLAVDRFRPPQYKEIKPAEVVPLQQKLVKHWLSNNSAAEKIKQLKLPTLILNGEKDSVIPPVNSVILANSIKYAKLDRWKEGGHGMLYQFPEEIAHTVSGFVNQS